MTEQAAVSAHGPSYAADGPVPLADVRMAGNIARVGADRLEGWCWSADRPQSRLTVEVLADDRPVARVVAGLFRRDLATAKIGDGRHSFVLHIPEAHRPGEPGFSCRDLDAAGMIGLREQSTGQLVARIRQKAATETAAEESRLASMRATLASFQRAAAAPLRVPGERMRDAFSMLGDALAARAEGEGGRGGALPDPIALAAQTMARTLAPVRLPIVAVPLVSLVVLAAEDVGQTWLTIAALAPRLDAMRAELILVDDGADARTALLGVVVENLAIVRARPGLAAAGEAALETARAADLGFVDAGNATVPEAWTLADELRERGDDILIGAAALSEGRLLGLAGVLAPAPPAADGESAVVLAIGRDRLRRLGGLDLEFAAYQPLCLLDLALKAVLGGARVRVASGLPRPGGWPMPDTLRAPSSDAGETDCAWRMRDSAHLRFHSKWRLPASFDETAFVPLA